MNRILNSERNEQMIRCKHALIFIDQLTIRCRNDTISIHYYRSITYWCVMKLKHYLTIDKRKRAWIKMNERYVQMMQVQFCNNQNNHPDRMRILSDYAFHCYFYNSSIDNESINCVKKLVDEAKSMEKGMLSESEWNKSKLLIERSETDIECCEW